MAKLRLLFGLTLLLLTLLACPCFSSNERNAKGKKGGPKKRGREERERERERDGFRKLYDTTNIAADHGDSPDWSVHGSDFELPPDMVDAILERREKRRQERNANKPKDVPSSSSSSRHRRRNHTLDALTEAEILEDGDLLTSAAAAKIVDHENELRLQALNQTVDGSGANQTSSKAKQHPRVQRTPEEIQDILEAYGFSSYEDLDDYLDELDDMYDDMLDLYYDDEGYPLDDDDLPYDPYDDDLYYDDPHYLL